MLFKNFNIHSEPFFSDAWCSCGNRLETVSNGFMSNAFYCPTCENVYELKLIKVPNNKVDEDFLKQCRKEVIRSYRKPKDLECPKCSSDNIKLGEAERIQRTRNYICVECNHNFKLQIGE